MGQSWLKQKIAHHFPGIEFDVLLPPDPQLGDYSSNIAFALAKEGHGKPMEIAQRTVIVLRADPEIADVFERIESAGAGFVNFFLKTSFLQNQLKVVYDYGKRYGSSQEGKGKTVIVEYSSPNIAKPMHVGHMRSTIIGDALANIHEFLGYKVVRWNYLGDWGTQFGNLIYAYKHWGTAKKVQVNPIQTLLELYVKFHNEMKHRPGLEKEGQEEFKKLENGDRENRKLWQWFKQESIKEFNKIYATLGIAFTVTRGESDYEKELMPFVDFVRQQKLVSESQGATIFDLTSFGLPPALIRKSDGASLYFTRDVVSLQKRIDSYNPAKILYVVANQQALHFQQLFAAAHILGLDTTELVHVKFGLVLGEDRQKLATREGKIVPLDNVIKTAIRLARVTAEDKNPKLSAREKGNVSETVGIGALKYNDLKEHRNSDIVFDWERMLDLSGNSTPYLQYTYARFMSISRKAGSVFIRWLVTKPDVSRLTEPSELQLIKQLINFPETVRHSAHTYLTNNLALYLYELANLANRFYQLVRVLEDEDKKRRDARVMLVETVAQVLKIGLKLLGIKTLERI